jgi:hypothetical protein
VNVYPDLPIFLESPKGTLTSKLIDRAVGGELRGRSFWDAPKATFSCTHAALDDAQRRSVEDFHADNMASVFEFEYDDVSYFVYYTQDPEYVPLGGGLWRVSFGLQEA